MRTKHLLMAILLVFLLISCDRTMEPQLPATATLGKPAPDFLLSSTHGDQWHLSSLKGKVVFLNFWATWCPPCRDEMPSMVALDRDMAGKPFQMLTVLSNDNPQIAENFVRKLGAAFPVLIDPENRIGKAYGLTGVPETFIIDANGILQEKYIGPNQWNAPETQKRIAGYLP